MGNGNLDRFVEAQRGAYPQALAELRAGAKTSHWMWFVFPQLAGLGRSATARFYAIVDRDEARAYHAHPVLGPRLAECVETMLTHAGRRSAEAILGPVDAIKLRSCCTLFEAAAASPAEARPFARCLAAFFDGERDPMTLRLLEE